MSDLYKKAEALLYTFPVNIMRRREVFTVYTLLKSGSDVHAQPYTDFTSTEGRHSDPAADYASRLMNLERRIAFLSGQIAPVARVRAELSKGLGSRDGIMLQIMELHYFERWGTPRLAEHLRMNRRTLYRRRSELVHRVMREIE